MQQIAVAAESLGYDGVLIPTGSSCLDPWITAASLVPVTHRLKLLVALRTSLGNPTASARQAATLDQASNGRLLLNVVPGGDATELAADGIFLDHDQRYELASSWSCFGGACSVARWWISPVSMCASKARRTSSNPCSNRTRPCILAGRPLPPMSWRPNRSTPT